MKIPVDKFQLPKPYQRALSSSLSLVEGMLSELESLVQSQRTKSIFTDSVAGLNTKSSQLMQQELKNMRIKLRELKTTLALDSATINNSALISSRCGAIWEILEDLKVKRLYKYGAPPKGLSNYLDGRIQELVEIIKKIANLNIGKNK